MLHQDRYNALPSHPKANDTFRRQLLRAFDANDTNGRCEAALKLLLSELYSDVFSRHEGKFLVWLLHGHYELNSDEKMVSEMRDDLDIMEPTNQLHGVIEENWDFAGNPLEHRRLVDGDIPPTTPSDGLWVDFKRVMERRRINSLGVCNFPGMPGVDDGFVYVETTSYHEAGRSLRRHVLTRTPLDGLDTNLTPTAWIPGPSTIEEVRKYLATPDDCKPNALKFTGCTHTCINGQHVEK